MRGALMVGAVYLRDWGFLIPLLPVLASASIPGPWLMAVDVGFLWAAWEMTGLDHIHIRTRIRTPSDNCPHTSTEFTTRTLLFTGSKKEKSSRAMTCAPSFSWTQLCLCACVIQQYDGLIKYVGVCVSARGWVRELGVEHSLFPHLWGRHMPQIWITILHLSSSKMCIYGSWRLRMSP